MVYLHPYSLTKGYHTFSGKRVKGRLDTKTVCEMTCTTGSDATVVYITESVDSVCRDGTDMPYVAEAWKTLLKQQLLDRCLEHHVGRA